jgi:2-polyprenyl-3-methyl-5-hydroxy-6-metoxy-1,4-benzoquinol methylase
VLTEHRAATDITASLRLSEEAAHQVRQAEPHFPISYGSKKKIREITKADASAVVEHLARLARGRRALELGVGKGRIELSLAAQGIKVAGVDASPRQIQPASGPTLHAISASRLPHWWRSLRQHARPAVFGGS